MKEACNKIGGVLDGGKKIVDKTADLGGQVVDKAKDLPGRVVDNAKDLPGQVLDKIPGIGRKKRSITLSRQKRGLADPVCGAIKNIDKPFDLNSLIGLKDLSLKDLKPDIADMSQLKTKFSNAMDEFLSVTQTIIDTLKKIFYILTLVYMMYDGYRYVFSPNIYFTCFDRSHSD